jgi:hypothetical protein
VALELLGKAIMVEMAIL